MPEEVIPPAAPTPIDWTPSAKVRASTLGAGLGGGAAFVGAAQLAALIVDLTGISLSEQGLQGLTVVIAMLVSAASSFGFGYVKKESGAP